MKPALALVSARPSRPTPVITPRALAEALVAGLTRPDEFVKRHELLTELVHHALQAYRQGQIDERQLLTFTSITAEHSAARDAIIARTVTAALAIRPKALNRKRPPVAPFLQAYAVIVLAAFDRKFPKWGIAPPKPRKNGVRSRSALLSAALYFLEESGLVPRGRIHPTTLYRWYTTWQKQQGVTTGRRPGRPRTRAAT
jgi:hypothetical protein